MEDLKKSIRQAREQHEALMSKIDDVKVRRWDWVVQWLSVGIVIGLLIGGLMDARWRADVLAELAREKSLEYQESGRVEGRPPRCSGATRETQKGSVVQPGREAEALAAR